MSVENNVNKEGIMTGDEQARKMSYAWAGWVRSHVGRSWKRNLDEHVQKRGFLVKNALRSAFRAGWQAAQVNRG